MSRRSQYKSHSLNKKESRRLKLSFILSFYLVIMLFTSVFGISKNFVKAEAEAKPVYVDSRVVMPGDTLWSIAESYNSDYYSTTEAYVEAIKECNGLFSDDIYAGTRLIIPYTK